MAKVTLEEIHEELERVKHMVGSHLGIDMQSPAQREQAAKDAEDAAKQAEKEAAKAAAE